MHQWLINYGTLLAFAAILVDLAFQISQVWRRRSSNDISVLGFSVRFLSAFLLLAKYFTLADKYLIAGQIFVVMLLSTYFVLIIRYHSRPTKRAKSRVIRARLGL